MLRDLFPRHHARYEMSRFGSELEAFVGRSRCAEAVVPKLSPATRRSDYQRASVTGRRVSIPFFFLERNPCRRRLASVRGRRAAAPLWGLMRIGRPILWARSHLLKLPPLVRSDRIHRPGDGTCSGRRCRPARTYDSVSFPMPWWSPDRRILSHPPASGA
jgi:hypothetical protein